MVWPGVTAFPDWFAPNTQDYWNNEFASFFNASGLDIDGLWIDMNEASNFCYYPCNNPEAFAEFNGDPPQPPGIRTYNPLSVPGWPTNLQPVCQVSAAFLLNVTTIVGQNLYMTGNITDLGMFFSHVPFIYCPFLCYALFEHILNNSLTLREIRKLGCYKCRPSERE